MHRYKKHSVAFILTLCLLCLLSPFAMATDETGEESDEILHITDVDGFLAFAQACRLDTFSQGLKVSLDADLDLGDIVFEPIPIFSGIFEGNGHTISGIHINQDGSVQGLFRYLTETAVVKELTVEGNVMPGGSHNLVGGIVGSNTGTIIGCRFEGTVSGGDGVGGIAGENSLTGIVESCRVTGSITGNHFVGGIVGENTGVIRSCSNSASVNTTPHQNTVDLHDITVDAITSTESADTATDIGGVAGMSSGVIRNCVNRGDIGYKLMGYNIGGIAGTQKGHIFGCENFGTIHGRKEIGGIVGQMEPVVRVEYTVDTLQILSEQLNGMSGIVSQVSAHAQSGTAAMSNDMDVLSGQIGEAATAVGKLLDDSGYIGGIPDPDTMQAIESTLSASMVDINVTLNSLTQSAESIMYAIAGDIRALSGQIHAMSETIDQARENVGVEFVDVSDEDTPDQRTGKVEKCINNGSVSADLNAGGIAGAIALVNDMNGFEDVLYFGEDSMNVENEFRAVILSCDNKADVTVKKQNGGGIVGWMTMGLVKESMNLGTLDADNADYLGGIAGHSSGFIRNCYASCSLFGDANVGGIAGIGTIISDCRSMVSLDGAEKTGGILGYAEDPLAVREVPVDKSEANDEMSEKIEEQCITGNFYLSLGRDIGAIDGISYANHAQALDMEAFMALEDIPVEFGTVSVRFVCEDGTSTSISLVPGGKLKENQVPAVPEKSGYTAIWDGLDKADLNRITKDLTFEALYTAKKPTIQSSEQRENDLPVMLAQGLFSGEQTIELRAISDHPALSAGEEWAETWAFSFPNGGEVSKLRVSLPPGSGHSAVRIMICSDEGQWAERSFSMEGSYVVFNLQEGDQAICLINSPDLILTALLCIGSVVAVVLVFLLRAKLKKK